MSTPAELTSTILPPLDDTSSILPAIVLRLKRRIAELEGQLANVVPEQKRDTYTYRNAGRGILKVVSLFEPIEALVAENDRRLDLAEAGSDVSDAEADEFLDNSAVAVARVLNQERNFRGYKELVRYVPTLKSALERAEPQELSLIYASLRKGADAARADDTKRLREAMASWLRKVGDPLEPESRSNRGLDHDETGRLICPVEWDWSDQSIRALIRNGDDAYIVTADSWPSFLYPRGHYMDPADEEAGLFRSALLVKTYRFIFTSPQSAKDVGDDNTDMEPVGKKLKIHTSRRGVAAIIGLHSVTPRSIAYAAVQLRFALSNLSQWHSVDGNFSYHDFYNHIIDFFERPPGPIAKEDVNKLLSWWNSQVFKAKPTPPPVVSSASVHKLAAKRAAREEAARLQA